MPNRPAMQDPRHQYPKPPFPQQPQPAPGIAGKMEPQPDHGETSYTGSGRLEGRRALITGGDSGIGRAAAIAYAREGADVAIGYLPSEEADAAEVIALIEAEGRKAVGLPGDVKDEDWCCQMVEQTVAGLGGLDILVVNAARQQYREDISEVSTDDFDATMKTNLYALHWICQAAVPHLPPGAAIITTASVVAYHPAPPAAGLLHHQGRYRRLYQGVGEAGDREGYSRQRRSAGTVLDGAAAERRPTRREGADVRRGQRFRPPRPARRTGTGLRPPRQPGSQLHQWRGLRRHRRQGHRLTVARPSRQCRGGARLGRAGATRWNDRRSRPDLTVCRVLALFARHDRDLLHPRA